MRRTTSDKTLERNHVQKWRFLIREYELVKSKKHSQFKFVTDFYKQHGLTRQTFIKYYNRFAKTGGDDQLIPRKRGPKYRSRCPLRFIEEQVLKQRRLGVNRYEINRILKPKLKGYTPSPSGIYNIIKRHGLNRLKVKHKESKRKIIKERAGQLIHIDCHYLSRNMIVGDSTRYYLVGMVDSCTRLAWVELVRDIKSLTVMFAALRCMNVLNAEYQIKVEELLSDNGAEFKSTAKDKKGHAFERMLIEMNIKHRYTKPYRPQTNGKVERFWRTLNDDLIDGTTFDSINHFEEELHQYLYYYNELRPHQGLDSATPAEFNKSVNELPN